MSDTHCTRCGTAFAPEHRFCAACGTARGTVLEATQAPLAASGPPPAPSNAPLAVGLMVALFAVVPLGVLAYEVFGSGSVEGRLVAAGGPTGGFTLEPTGCRSMQPFGRFGANLHGKRPNDGGIYVTSDPTRGQEVEIAVPGSCAGAECAVFAVPRERCELWDVSVEHTNVIVNDVRLVTGWAKLRCTLDDGTVLAGDLAFSSC